MPPNCVSASSTSLTKFVPSLGCIAEEEPNIIAIRRISVSPESRAGFEVEIPIYDVNIYAPEIPGTPLSESYQRLLAEMEKYIGKQENSEKYQEMAKNLRLKIATEQAEATRLSNPNFSDRDWYWYSEQTRSFVDEPIDSVEKEMKVPTTSTSEAPTVTNDDIFDLNADF